MPVFVRFETRRKRKIMKSLSKYVDKPLAWILKQWARGERRKKFKSWNQTNAGVGRSCSLLISHLNAFVSYRLASLLSMLLLNRQIRNYFSNKKRNQARREIDARAGNWRRSLRNWIRVRVFKDSVGFLINRGVLTRAFEVQREILIFKEKENLLKLILCTSFLIVLLISINGGYN